MNDISRVSDSLGASLSLEDASEIVLIGETRISRGEKPEVIDSPDTSLSDEELGVLLNLGKKAISGVVGGLIDVEVTRISDEMVDVFCEEGVTAL